MTTSAIENDIRALRQAYFKFSRQLGKHTAKDVAVLSEHLYSTELSKRVLSELTKEWEDKDTFAGYGRLDGLAIRIQMYLLREFGVKVNL